MSQPTWKFVQLNTVLVADAGWHRDSDDTITKLANSLQRHGQLRPLVVRGVLEDDSMCTLVEGHKLLGAMLTLGWTQAMAVHLGEIDADAAVRVALALELEFRTDFSRMVAAVTPLMERGATAAELAAGSPLSVDRLKHFPALSKLDWSVFGHDNSQARLDWDALEEPPVLVLDTDTGVVTRADDGSVVQALATSDSMRELPQVVDIAPPILPAEPLEDVTAPEPQPAAPVPPPPAAAEPAAAPAGEPAAKPGKAAKPKAAKAEKAPPVPKAPNAQLGLF